WGNMLDTLKGDWTSSQQHHYGIAGGVASTLIYYNKSMFDKAGIKTVPTDFTAFLAACAQLKKAGFVPIVWNGGFPNMLGNGPFSSGFANAVAARHPQWKAQLADGRLNLDTPEVEEIFARIKRIPDLGYVQKDYLHTSYDEGIRLFNEGKAAMTFQGTWASGLLMNGHGFKTGIMLPPWNDAGQSTVPVIGSETGFGVSETSNKAASLKFLEFIYDEGFVIQQNKRQNIPPLKKTSGVMISDPQVVAYVKNISAAPVTAGLYYAFLPANTIELLHPLLQDVLFGTRTPRQAAKALDDSIKTEARNRNR
ncbi:MAG: extracellular solute-binding protein, partial [Herminiimonas sp.]|nr:extracellular solute-binding protein [Herminiimonas sp.]